MGEQSITNTETTMLAGATATDFLREKVINDESVQNLIP
jgi:hypothetical protein